MLRQSCTFVARQGYQEVLHSIKNYHIADINLFWKDIQLNAIQRLEAWNKMN